MAAYVIINAEIHDPAGMGAYLIAAPTTVAPFGGTYLVRGGAIDVIEGAWEPTRLAIIRFGSADQARAWLDSPEYRPFREMREKAANSNVVIVEGL